MSRHACNRCSKTRSTLWPQRQNYTQVKKSGRLSNIGNTSIAGTQRANSTPAKTTAFPNAKKRLEPFWFGAALKLIRAAMGAE